MDFKQIEAFVNVVRFKSFSRAADATFFTQPTVGFDYRACRYRAAINRYIA